MKCTRCSKATDYYYMAGPVVLCEDCACNSVSALADEGLFPFFDNVVTVQSGDGTSIETTVSESVPESSLSLNEEREALLKDVNKKYGLIVTLDKAMENSAELPAMTVEDFRLKYPTTTLSDEEIQNVLCGKNPDGTENKNIDPYWAEKYQ